MHGIEKDRPKQEFPITDLLKQDQFAGLIGYLKNLKFLKRRG